jgi:hypothetical protein
MAMEAGSMARATAIATAEQGTVRMRNMAPCCIAQIALTTPDLHRKECPLSVLLRSNNQQPARRIGAP